MNNKFFFERSMFILVAFGSHMSTICMQEQSNTKAPSYQQQRVSTVVPQQENVSIIRTIGQEQVAPLFEQCIKKIPEQLTSSQAIDEIASILPMGARKQLINVLIMNNDELRKQLYQLCPIQLVASFIAQQNFNGMPSKKFSIKNIHNLHDYGEQSNGACAFACAQHPRLGVNSPAALLDRELTKTICTYRESLIVESRSDSFSPDRQLSVDILNTNKISIIVARDGCVIHELAIQDIARSDANSAHFSNGGRFLVASGLLANSPCKRSRRYNIYDLHQFNNLENEIKTLTNHQALLLVYLFQSPCSDFHECMPLIESLKGPAPTIHSIITTKHRQYLDSL